MDPLLTIFAISTVLNTAFNLAQKCRRALVNDNRFSTIYFTFMGEKRKYEAWANNMRLVGNSIPLEDIAAVNDIRESLEKTLDKAQKMFQRFQTYKPEIGGKPLHPKVTDRMKWALWASDEIEDLLKLVRTLNEVLGIMAPILPPYTLPGTVSTQTAASAEFTATGEEINEFDADSLGGISEQPATPAFNNVLQRFYDTCLKGLNLIGLAKDEIGDLARRQTYQLHLWGTGLFDDELSLEELLYASVKKTESLYTFLLEAFVDIAIVEEQILRRWVSEACRFNQRALNNTRMQITAILGTEEVAHLTMEKWLVMLGEEAEEGPYSDEQEIDVLRKTIEVLFDMLPAIRSVRRGYILSIEASESLESSTDGTKVTSIAKRSITDTDALIDKNLEQIAIIEKAASTQEVTSPEQDRKVKLFSRRVGKTRLRLEELEQSRMDDKQTTPKVGESEEVGKVQRELSRELARFFDSKSGLLLTESRSSRQQSGSEKPPLEKPEKPELLDPADLERIANIFDMATSHLFTITSAG